MSFPTLPCTTEVPPLTKTQSFKHQAEVIAETKDLRYFGLFMEQGTGKTHVSIATFAHLYMERKIDGVLILAPNGVHDNWVKNEIPIHCALPAEEIVVACWHSSDGVKKRRAWEYVAAADWKDRLCVLAANIEAVRTTVFLKSIEGFVKRRRFLLIIDESTTIKNPKADVTKAVLRISKNAAYCRILTGTPITQSPLDLWSQCRVLDECALPYPSYTAFKHEFAIEETMNLGQRQFTKVVGYKNQHLLAELLKPFTKRILKKDCLDLPEKIYQTRYVELTPEQKRIYKALTQQCLADLGPGMVTVTTAITMMLRLHQVTLGYVQDDDGTMRSIQHNRIDRLVDVLDENRVKTIIFVRFLQDLAQVTEVLLKLDRKFVTYSGEDNPQERQVSIDEFQNGDAEYFICTSAAARGLTLTNAEAMVYYSQDFRLETRLQSEDRAHRIGQTKNVLYTDLVAQGTIDEKVVEALRNKKELADSVLDRAGFAALLQLDEG